MLDAPGTDAYGSAAAMQARMADDRRGKSAAQEIGHGAVRLREPVDQAGVAELVDAPGLGPGDESLGGSSPSARTTGIRVIPGGDTAARWN